MKIIFHQIDYSIISTGFQQLLTKLVSFSSFIFLFFYFLFTIRHLYNFINDIS